jgi:chemotaxis protein CheD
MILITNNTINVSLGEIMISDDPELVLACYGLGSCIGVSAYDPFRRIGALIHIVLPAGRGKPESTPAKYADTAIPHMIQELEKKGASRNRLIIKIAGGAKILNCIPAGSVLDIGAKNVVAVSETIMQNKLSINNQDVRGNIGRTIFLYIKDGRTVVKTAMNEVIEL